MNANFFTSAFFRFRNIFTLTFWLAVAYLITTNQYFLESINSTGYGSLITAGVYGSGVVLYLALVMQSIFSDKYKEEYKRKEKKKQIHDLNKECMRLSTKIREVSPTPVQRQKVRKIIQDKNDILNSLKRGEEYSYLKEKLVEQSLNLVVSYIKLLTNYSIRMKEISEVNVSDLVNKINANRRKVEFMRDVRLADDVKGVIEMDEKVIERIKEEKNELERIHARLDYIESMISAFKHQIISSIETEEMVEKLETAVNEAVALDNVLQERRRNRLSM